MIYVITQVGNSALSNLPAWLEGQTLKHSMLNANLISYTDTNL